MIITLTQVPTTGVFIYTMGFHLITEFFAVFGRLTEKYYKTSRYLVHRWTPRNCLDHIQDDCTYAEWRNRLAMDIVVKFGVSLCTGVFFLVNIAVNLPLYLGDGADADSDFEDDAFQWILIYFGSSVLIEFVFYVLMIVLQWKLYNYSMSRPFVGYIKELNNLHILFLLLLYGSVVVPVY